MDSEQDTDDYEGRTGYGSDRRVVSSGCSTPLPVSFSSSWPVAKKRQRL
jgi:hypothetical protein